MIQSVLTYSQVELVSSFPEFLNPPIVGFHDDRDSMQTPWKTWWVYAILEVEILVNPHRLQFDKI